MIKNFNNEVIGKSLNDEVIIRLQDNYSLPLCIEFQKFIYGGNFDRISTMILAMYEFRKDEFVKRANLQRNTTTSKLSFAERLKRK